KKNSLPINVWELLEKSWASRPQLRPTAKTLKNFFSSLYQLLVSVGIQARRDCKQSLDWNIVTQLFSDQTMLSAENDTCKNVYDTSENRLSITDLENCEKLISWPTGETGYLGILNKSTKVAIQCIKTEIKSNELQILSELNHKNILKLFDIVENNAFFWQY